MPTLFTSTLYDSAVRQPVMALHGAVAVVAWRGEANRLCLATTSHFLPTELNLCEICTTEEQSDAPPALISWGQQVYLAWKGNGNARLYLARVELTEPYPGYPVVSGLSHREMLDVEGLAPLHLLDAGDRLILGYATAEGTYACTGVRPADRCPADPLGPMEAVPPGLETACELRRIGYAEETAAFACGDTWNLMGRVPTPEAIVLGPGWYSLFLTLKEGQPEVYHAGDTSEWQAIAGEQVLLDEQEEALETPESVTGPCRHFIAVSDPNDVAGQAEALAAIDEESLRQRYDALAETEYAARLSDADFAQVWQTLQQVRAFIGRAAEARSYVVHRRRIPAETEAPLEPVGIVTPVSPVVAEAAALVPDLGVLAACMDSHGVEPNSPDNEWPYNLLSQRTVKFASGRLARAGDAVVHDYDPQELARAHRIAAEFLAHVQRFPVRHSDLRLDFQAICLPVNRGEPVCDDLTPEQVRQAFRGTLHPWATITVEPLADCQVRDLSSEASFYGYRHKDVRAHNGIWKEMLAWVKSQPDLVGGWYVSVDGAIEGVDALRLIVGKTEAGSLAGVVSSGRAWAMTHAYTPEQIYTELRKMEVDALRAWVDADGRFVARVILSAFDAATLSSWNETTLNATHSMRQKYRAPYWRGQFHQLSPLLRQELSPAWATVQRCLLGGRFTPDSAEGRPEAVFFGWDVFGAFDSVGDRFHAFTGDQVTQRSERLQGLSEAWLRQRYDDLRATDYAPHRSEADWQATWQAFQALRTFYQTAAEAGWTVVVHVTARSEEALAAEATTAADPNGQNKPTTGKVKRKRKAAPGEPEMVTDCTQDDTLLAPLLESMEAYGMDEEGNDWPHNGISHRAVRYTCGQVAQPETVVIHRHDPSEIERCQQIAIECEQRLHAYEPAHDQGGPYRAFFVAANRDESVEQAITEEFLRNRVFGGTICPRNYVTIEPLTEMRGPTDVIGPFRQWFEQLPGLHGHVTVTIGTGSDDESGVVCPRLAVALTDKGSLVGVFGYDIFA